MHDPDRASHEFETALPPLPRFNLVALFALLKNRPLQLLDIPNPDVSGPHRADEPCPGQRERIDFVREAEYDRVRRGLRRRLVDRCDAKSLIPGAGDDSVWQDSIVQLVSHDGMPKACAGGRRTQLLAELDTAHWLVVSANQLRLL